MHRLRNARASAFVLPELAELVLESPVEGSGKSAAFHGGIFVAMNRDKEKTYSRSLAALGHWIRQ